jgi:hypothetical protein
MPTARYYHRALSADASVSWGIHGLLPMVPFLHIMGVVCFSEGVPIVMEPSTTILRRPTMRQGRQGMCRVYEPMPHVGVGDGLASLQIVCAWCQQPLRRQPVQTPTRFTISYSICARCYEDVARESEDTTGSECIRDGRRHDRSPLPPSGK